MKTINTDGWRWLTALGAALLVPEGASLAQDDVEWVTTHRGRYEMAIGAHSWPGLADLDAARDGEFDEAGFNINLAAHWPVRRFADSELLAGLDLGILTNDSNIRFISESVSARNAYITPSLKWMVGHGHRYSLDAGLGYYMQDMAEVIWDYAGFAEAVLWEEAAPGGYIGGTIDFRGGDPARSHGIMMSVKVHFVDFGTVRDAARLPQTLGQDAGDLTGPIYMAQVGYRWR
jgi:hypothetical protein